MKIGTGAFCAILNGFVDSIVSTFYRSAIVP